MKLKSYNGSIRSVTEVIATVEARYNFNGSVRRLIEPCKDSSVKPNAVAFVFESDGFAGPCMTFGQASGNLLVGNLPAETVESIVDSLLTKGFADISQMSFQKKKGFVDCYEFDGGKVAGPYYAVGGLIFNQPVWGIQPPQFGEEDIEDDEFTEDDDDTEDCC